MSLNRPFTTSAKHLEVNDFVANLGRVRSLRRYGVFVVARLSDVVFHETDELLLSEGRDRA